MPAFRRCYERQLRLEPHLEGRVTVRVAVDATGAVSSATASDDGIDSAAVRSCFERAAASIRFPAPDAPTRFSFPFLFDPGR